MDILLLMGIAISLGFIGGKFSNRLRFPAVVGYIVIGLFLGPSFLDLLKLDLLDRIGIISDIALALIAFVIGSQLPLSLLRRLGGSLIIILVMESLGAFIIVTLGVYFLTHKLYLALIFGALAPATAPAGTVAVLQEYRAKGPLTNALLAIVGFDDGVAIGIYAFAAALARAFILGEEGLSFHNAVGRPLIEIGGALLSGIVIGMIWGYLIRRMRTRGELLTVSLGAILVCAGVANFFHLSLILANLTLGMVVASAFPRVSRRTLEVVEAITPPVYVLFFVTAGAHLQLALLRQMGLLGLIYIIGRTAGKMSGAFLGASIAKAERTIRKYLPFGLLSQAGVAIGLAILVGREFGDLGEVGRSLAILTINTIAATTIIFEIIGPITTKFAIAGAGEVGKEER